MPKTSARQWLVSCSGTDGLWAQKTGGQTTADVSKAWDGGAHSPDLLTAPATTSDVTITRPYDEQRDGPMVRRLRGTVGRSEHSIRIVATDENLVRRGGTSTYHGILTGVSAPDTNAAGSDASEVSLTFTIRNVT
jgi:hypothetical protein